MLELSKALYSGRDKLDTRIGIGRIMGSGSLPLSCISRRIKETSVVVTRNRWYHDGIGVMARLSASDMNNIQESL